MKIPVGVENAIDRISVIRDQIKMLKTEETELADSIKQYMEKRKIKIIETVKTKAELSTKGGGAIDPESYYDALEEDFEKFLETVSVRKESKGDKVGADRYLSQEKIEEITEKSKTSVVLYIRSLKKAEGYKAASV